MRELTSLSNPVIKEARALQSAGAREAARAFLLDGEHMVGEALSVCPERVRAVFVDSARLERYAALVSRAPEVYAVPEHVLAALSQVKTPQGVAAVCGQPPPAALDALGGRILLLENVQDPGNVGTMLRTLDAAGFTGCVLTPGCADPFSPKTLRASMGSVFRVPLARVSSAAEAVRALNARGFATLAAALDGVPFYSRPPLPAELCVMIGNEGAGLTREAQTAAAYRFRLPMNGGAESLNAAIAAAILMYDLVNR